MALSGSEKTRIAVGGSGLAYSGFTAKFGVVITIDGANTAVLTMQYESLMLVSDNDSSKWWII